MKKSSRHFRGIGAAVMMMALTGVFTMRSQANEQLPVSDLSAHTHIHGIAVDPRDPAYLYIATHHGVFRTEADGSARRISETRDDFMGFTPHPAEADVFYASGHPAGGGNLGFIASTDRGRTWRQLSPGVNGPVDFHQMTVSPADPKTIYGAYRGLQISRDAGRTWKVVGPAPAGLIDLAASAKNPDTLYAATEAGLLVSIDAGRSWQSLLKQGPVTLVEVTQDGTLYAFVAGKGLIRSAEGATNLTTVTNAFGSGYLLHLAIDPTDPRRLFAVTGESKVLASTDQGQSWTAFRGSSS